MESGVILPIVERSSVTAEKRRRFSNSRSSRPRTGPPVSAPATYSFSSFSIQHADWHEKFRKALEHEAFRRAYEGLRALEAEAAQHRSADARAFRQMLVCLLEDAVFRTDLQNTLPSWWCFDLILRYDREIKRLVRWKAVVGSAPSKPKELVSPAWKIVAAINEQLRWLREQRQYVRGCASAYEPETGTIDPTKKDVRALARLCLAIYNFTGHRHYSEIADLLEVASFAKGDRDEEWKANTVRTTVVRFMEHMYAAE
jgi:hypothetical protein